jgi:hypothetical protein
MVRQQVEGGLLLAAIMLVILIIRSWHSLFR